MEMTLSPEHEEYIASAVESGQFTSRAEALNAAVESLKRQDADYCQYVEGLNDAVAQARAEVARGEYKDYSGEELDTLFCDIKAKGRKRVADSEARTT
jgi:Arc/MetJ-type ribon-helix-helix transcriptional regulator